MYCKKAESMIAGTLMVTGNYWGYGPVSRSSLYEIMFPLEEFGCVGGD